MFHQHLNSHIAYPGSPPKPLNHTREKKLKQVYDICKMLYFCHFNLCYQHTYIIFQVKNNINCLINEVIARGYNNQNQVSHFLAATTKRLPTPSTKDFNLNFQCLIKPNETRFYFFSEFDNTSEEVNLMSF